MRKVALVLVLTFVACQAARTPEERELADLDRELRQLEADIAAMRRVASASGEAPPGELGTAEERRDELKTQIEGLRRRIEAQKGE